MRQAFEHLLRQSWQRRGWLGVVMWPISALLGWWVRLRQRLYQWGVLSSHRLPVPVIVVGNVMVGGVGKTPIVMALVEHLTQQGLRVGVVSRGHGRSAPARAAHPVCEVTLQSLASEVGDEPLLIHTRCHVPVWVGTHRVDVARALLRAHPQVQVLISDDGLQHLALARDIELCVFDERGIGNGWLLPAGPLREPWPRHVLNPDVQRFELSTSPSPLPVLSHAHAVQRRLSDTAYQADGSQRPLHHWQQHPAQALAGIAKPQAFFDMLSAQGLQLTHTLALPDHAKPQTLHESAAGLDPQQGDVLCTEKDAVKLWQTLPQAWAVPLAVELPATLLAQLDQSLRRVAGEQLVPKAAH